MLENIAPDCCAMGWNCGLHPENLSSSRDSRPLTFTVSRSVFVMLMSRTNRVTVEVLIELPAGTARVDKCRGAGSAEQYTVKRHLEDPPEIVLTAEKRS